MVKVCSKCREVKPRSEFYAHRTKLDGLQSECKSCKRASRRTYERSPAAKQRRREAQARWVNAHPEKAAAHQLVRQAKRKGRLAPQPCAQCGNQGTEAHHHNGYTGEAATDVKWLCKRCHTAAHHEPAKRGEGLVYIEIRSGVTA